MVRFGVKTLHKNKKKCAVFNIYIPVIGLKYQIMSKIINCYKNIKVVIRNSVVRFAVMAFQFCE